MSTPKLTTPHLRVVLDDTEHEVYAYNRDLVAYEQLSLRAPTKYPPAQTSPFVWLNFLAYKAGQREGFVADTMSLPDFTDAAREVSILDEAAPVDPTQPDPGAG